MIFFNISHHPSNKWDKSQIEAATIDPIGNKLKIIDIQFPAVLSSFTKSDIMKICNRYINRVLSLIQEETGESYKMDNSVTAHIMGEYSLFYYLVKAFKENGFRVVVSTTDKITNRENNGQKIKFVFKQFREI
jgi:hypothetical protein